jgi:hypothetical protein
MHQAKSLDYMMQNVLDFLPLQNLQQLPGTLNCSCGLHESGGHIVSGSMRLHFIKPSRHSHSTHSFGFTDSPWSYISPLR